LICPLNWGLGHATRCIPIIQSLLHHNIEVIIGAEDGPLALLKGEFPKLSFIDFPGYKFSYPANGSMAVNMVMSTPQIFKGIAKEHKKLDELIELHNIDAVISDNRYGLWSEKVKSVFITHQLKVKSLPLLKFLEPVLFQINKRFIAKYNECWVPDHEGEENLSGALSHGHTLPNVKYIGPLSRFERFNGNAELNGAAKKYDIMVILSGPEPQRTVFEKIVLEQLENSSYRSIVVQGTLNGKMTNNKGIHIFSHLDTEKMRQAILSSELILCRPGYSSIMDLAVLGKKAAFVPTPGQTEQEYLAKMLHEKGVVYSEKQKSFDLKRAVERSSEFIGLKTNSGKSKLEKVIEQFLKTI